jgi:poly-gamma-glutamate capsule biosynthesis protein CapA/YwtB (metallophosphatase superfamily)
MLDIINTFTNFLAVWFAVRSPAYPAKMQTWKANMKNKRLPALFFSPLAAITAASLALAVSLLIFGGCSPAVRQTPVISAQELVLTPEPSLTAPAPSRAPEPTPVPSSTVATLAVCGDVMSHMPQTNDAYDPKTGNYDYSECLKYVKDWLSKADFALANLETTLGGEPYTSYPMFSTPDGLAYSLKSAGIDLVSTANNHCMDTGYAGLCRTLDTLDKAGLQHVGTYRTQAEHDAYSGIVVSDVGGISVAFLSYTYGTNGIPVSADNRYSVNLFNTDYLSTICTPDEEKLKRDLAAAKKLNTDLIAVMIHWGLEYYTNESSYQDEVADFLITNGANLVLGGHSHVCEPMEYRTVELEDGGEATGLVIFSLGNFISGQSPYSLENGEYTDTTAIVNLELTKDPLTGKCSVTRVSYVPCLMLNRYTSERRYYLLDAYRCMKEYESGDTQIVTYAVYSRLKKAVEDCRDLLGSAWLSEYDADSYG